MRIGHGYDVHRLVSGRALILGGVTIPYERGWTAIPTRMCSSMPSWTRCSARRPWATSASSSRTTTTAISARTAWSCCARSAAGLKGPDTASATSMRPSSPSGQSSRRISTDAPEYRGRTAYRSWERQRQGNDGGAPRLHRLRRGDRRPCRLSDRIVNGAAAGFISLQPRFSGRQNADRSSRVACCACRRAFLPHHP